MISPFRISIGVESPLVSSQRHSILSLIVFIDSVMEKWHRYFKEHGGATLGMELDKSELSHMDLLNQNLKQMMEKIHSTDFLSTESLDAYHKELLEKIRQEKENALNEMNSFMAYNPKKLLAKILDDVANAMKKIESADDDGAGGTFLNKFTTGFVKGNLQEGMRYLNDLMDQVENIQRRSK